MLFVARSPSFLEVTRVESKALAGLTEAARSTQLPWLVLTYLLPGEAPNAAMETACAQSIETLLEHMKQRPKAHPLTRVRTGFPLQQAETVLRFSAGMLHFAYRLLAALTGSQELMNKVTRTASKFTDCLPSGSDALL